MVFELKHEVEDNQNGEIHIPSSCFQINKNKIFTINIHEYLKFLQQFKLCIFLAENIKIASDRQIFILTFWEKFRFLSELWSWFRVHFCPVTKNLIKSYVLILISVPRYQHSQDLLLHNIIIWEWRGWEHCNIFYPHKPASHKS